MTAKEKLMPIISFGCYVLTGYTLYRYFKNVPKITIDQNFISFNKQIFAISDIEKVELAGKKPFKYVGEFPMEAATIVFSNGEIKYLFDDMYSNIWEIKSFLHQILIDQKNFKKIAILKDNEEAVKADVYETFKGNQFTSLRGISLWGFVGFMTYLLLVDKRQSSAPLLLYFSISGLWLLAHSYLMHYFKVSENFLVVKNHNFFWKNKVFFLADIKEVVFETQGKMPNCLRIITNDFRNKFYPAGTLRDKTWLALKYKLESHSIIVRNECV